MFCENVLAFFLLGLRTYQQPCTMKRKTSCFTETLVLSININGVTRSDSYYRRENSQSLVSSFCLPNISNINISAVRTTQVVVTLTSFHVQSEVLHGSRALASMELLIWYVSHTERKTIIYLQEIYILLRFDGVNNKNTQLLNSYVAKCEE